MAAEKIELFEIDVDYSSVLDENVKLLKLLNQLKKEQKDLVKSTENLTEATDEQAQAYVENSNSIKQLTKDYNSNNKVLQALTDTQVNNIETVEDGNKALTAIDTLWRNTTKLEGENSESSRKLGERKKELKDRINVLKKETGDYTSNIGQYKEGIDDAAGGTGAFGKVLGSLQSGVEGVSAKAGLLPGVLGRVTSGVGGVSKSLLALLANPVVLTVAGIVAIFTALYKVFKSTDEGGTELEAQFAKIGAIMDVLKRRAVILIDAFKALFSGDFKAAGEAFANVVEDIGEEMSEAADRTYELVYALDDLKDRQIAAISEQATLRREIEKNITLSKDQGRTDAERIAFLQKAGELELELATQKTKFANEAFDLELERASIASNVDKEVLRSFIALGEAEQTRQRATNKELGDAWNVLGDEVIESLERAYTLGIEAETVFFKKSKETTSQLSGLERKLSNERRKEANDRLKKTAKDLELELALFEAQNQTLITKNQTLNAEIVKQEEQRLFDIAGRQKEIARKRLAAGIINQTEYNIALIDIDNEYANSVLITNNLLLKQQQDYLDAAREQRSANNDAILEQEEQRRIADLESEKFIADENAITALAFQREQLDAEYAAEIENAQRIGADTALIDEKYRQATKEADILALQAKLGLAADFSNNLATVFGKQSKAGKAAAAAAATVSAIQGAVGAFASLSSIPIVGPVLGGAAAAAALAAGYANVKKIYKVDSGLPGDSGGGGSTPGGGVGLGGGGGGGAIPRAQVADGGLVSRGAADPGQIIKDGIKEGFEKMPRQVLVVDDVTAKQADATTIEAESTI